MYQFIKYEQETIINFNAGESDATVYTHDKAIMRKLDTLVTESRGRYPRQRKQARKAIKRINEGG